ncbi:MAG: PAS domain S-box protein [Desulfobacterales bacterium]
MKQGGNPFPIGIKAFIALAVILLLSCGAWFYRDQHDGIRKRIEEDLSAIARLKADQIAAWRRDQLDDAAFLQLHPFLSTSAFRFITEGSEGNRRDLQVRLRSLADQHGYANILLVAPDGKLLSSLSEPAEGDRGYLPALTEALQVRKPAFTTLHMPSPGASPHISVVAPLYGAVAPEVEAFAALVLISDASQFLYPLVQFWPAPSESAETLLVRQDGDEVLFLNELRHQPDTALQLRMPLSRTDVPAVMAVLGRHGVFRGKDYRGEEVLSVIHPIPDSPWFMVSKIDAAEAFAEWRFRSLLILGLLFGLMGCIVATGLVFWQRDKKAQYRALYLSEAALRESFERHSITLKAIGDAVIATDARGNVELLNPVAESLTGWTQAEARGRPLEEVFRIVNEQTGAKVEDPVSKVLREGGVVGLANHTLLISRNGTRRPIADSGAPIHDDDGRIIGVVLVFRDQTRERAASDKLAERERYYRSMLFNLHEDILVIDRDYHITDINNTALKTLGLTHAEVVGRKCFTVSHGLDSPCHENGESCALVEVFSTGAPSNCRHDHLRSDGTRAYIDILMSPLRDENGEVTHVIEAARDITDLVEAREALRQSEKKFRAIFENMALGCCLDEIVYSNGQAVDYRVLDVNPTYERLIGISRGRAAGTLASNLYGAGQAPNVEIYGKVDTTGKPVSFEFFFEPAGKHLQVTASRIAPGRFCTLFSDVTERKQVEEERERLLAAIEQAGEMFVITDPEGRIQYVNPAFEKATGYRSTEVVGMTPRILKSGKQEDAFYRKMWTTIAAGRPWQGRLVNKRKDGSLYTENAAIYPVCDNSGRILNYVAVKRDITEHLKLEAQFQQAQKIEAVGRLAGGVAHDYNNILSVIIGYSELALEKIEADDPLREDLEEIHAAANRSRDITRQLLAFARKETIAPKVLDLNETVESMLKMLRKLIGENIDLTWHPGKLPGPVLMDPSQLDQILANLCLNARDAITGVGRITIETSTATIDADYCSDHAEFEPGDFLLLNVSDDGCGMNSETMNNIFEPFFTTKRVGIGTGLGLATVYGIVRQNKGFINVYSEPGRGTTFKIYLPRHSGEITENQVTIDDQAPNGNGETVMVVEDETSILKLAERILSRCNYKVLLAKSPSKALETAQAYSGEIALLITDVVMPEMNGRELVDRIKKIRPGIKCLFMSGYTANVIAHWGVLDEGVQFIQKPFSTKGLAVKVSEALAKKTN